MGSKNKTIEISKLRWLATKYAERMITDEEIRQNNITEELINHIKETIEEKALLNWQILGDVTGGKSTLAMELCRLVNIQLLKPMTIDNICADQIDMNNKVKDPQLKNTCLVVDEWNALSETGLNTTTEQAWTKQFSQVQAQRFIHRIACSPDTIIDPLSNIILETINKNTKTQETTVWVNYRLKTAKGETIQQIGHAIINVSQTLNTQWYKKYLTKKFMKMEFITKHGVRDSRELKQASVILKVFYKLQPLAKQGLVRKEIIANYLEGERRKQKEIYSFLATDDLIAKIKGLLEIEKSINRVLQEIHHIQLKIRKTTNQKMKQDLLNYGEKRALLHGDLIELLEEGIADYRQKENVNLIYENI